MNKRRLFFLSIFCSFFFTFIALSYDNLIIHPRLTEAAIDVYEAENSNKLNQEEIEWIVKGSIDEDTDPRYLNHYYNPVNGQGLDDWDNVYGLYRHFEGVPAKAWAQNQNSVIGLTGDYSEAAILKNYQEGDKKRAFLGIGHVLHLIQDMAVPAHTRNDAHAMGDPYEKWAQDFGTINLKRLSFKKISNLNEVFDELSIFSHNNFFSKDTINIDSLKFVNIKNEIQNGENRQYVISTLNNFEYRLLFSKNPDSLIPVFQVDGDTKLNIDYWNLLYPQAVGYSAGTIDYFMDKFAEIDKENEKQQLSLWDKFKNEFLDVKNNAKYLFGDTAIASRLILNEVFDTGKENLKDAQYFTEANKELMELLAAKAKNNIIGLNEEIRKKVLGLKVIANNSTPAVKLEIKPKESVVIEQTEEENNSAKAWLKPLSQVPQITKKENTIQPESQTYKKPSGPPLILASPVSASEESLVSGPSGQASIESGDKIPPDTLIINAPVQISSSSGASFAFFSSEEGSFENNLDELGWNSSANEANFNDLADGNHQFKVRAIDMAGNVDPFPAVFNWRIDTAAPSLELIQKPGIYSATTTAIFEFNSNESVIYQYQFNSQEWSVCEKNLTLDNLAEGENSLKVRVIDEAGNTTETVYDWLVDITSPNAQIYPLNSEYEKSGFEVAWTGEDNFVTTSSGIENFDIQYKVGEGEWQTWINNIVSTSSIFNEDVANGEFINFRIRAIDAAGNVGEWSAETATKIDSHQANHLVISEVQISGATANDEFIELYNPTSNAIDLSNYSLQYRGSNSTVFQKKNFVAGALIPAKGYFLITSSLYAGSVPADMTQSSFNLSGTGGTIFLAGHNNLLTGDTVTSSIDRLAYGSGSYLYPEGIAYTNVPGANLSLERKASSASSGITLSSGGSEEWQGNGYDIDLNSDNFVLRNSSDPQNSSSPSEPISGVLLPGIINNFSVAAASTTSLSLSWTAPANANIADGAHYELRYKEKTGSCDLNINWQSGTEAVSLPVPASGEIQSTEIINLISGKEYCLALRVFNGQFFSSLSNQVSGQTLCGALQPAFSGNLRVTKNIADKSTTPEAADEHILIADFFDSTEQGFALYLPSQNCVGNCLGGGIGDTEPASRLIVELQYDDTSKLFTGLYRFCTDSGNVNQIADGRCKDGNFWGASRWAGNINLINTPKISILNANQYTDWLSP